MTAKQKVKDVPTPGPVPDPKEDQAIYSPMPKCRIKKRWELECSREVLSSQISWHKKQLDTAEESKKRQVVRIANGHGLAYRLLSDNIAKIQQEKGIIAALEREANIDLPTQIEQLELSAPEREERSQIQARMESLANLRHTKAKEIAAKILEIREVCKSHAELTGLLRELGKKIELASKTNFGSSKFETLATSLPYDLESASLTWLEWFLGSEPGKEPYVISKLTFELPETLRSANLWRQGETADLSSEEAEEAFKPPPVTPEQLLAIALRNAGGISAPAPLPSVKDCFSFGRVKGSF
jgi:hypothetical protein